MPPQGENPAQPTPERSEEERTAELEEILFRAEKTESARNPHNHKSSGSCLRRAIYELAGKGDTSPKDLLDSKFNFSNIVLEHFPSKIDRLNMVEAYRELYMGPRTTAIATEFDTKDELEDKGAPEAYQGDYQQLSYELDSARYLVDYLSLLEARVDEQAKKSETQEVSKQQTTRQIEAMRQERAKIGEALMGKFQKEKITFKMKDGERSVPLTDFMRRTGALLIDMQGEGITEAQMSSLTFGINRLRDVIEEIAPKREEKEILLEEWLRIEEAKLAKIRKLQAESFRHSLDEDSKREIEEKINYVQQNIRPIIVALRKII